MTKYQSNLESIRLRTDRNCSGGQDSSTTPFLSGFPKLRHLSWAGLTVDNLRHLADILGDITQQIEDLELNFGDPNELDTYYHICSLFSGAVNADGATNKVFSSLRVLSLAGFEICQCHEDLAHSPVRYSALTEAIDLLSLKSLKLRFCRDSGLLLSHMTAFLPPLALRSFEIQDSPYSEHEGTESPLLSFLENFGGLEELFIQTSTFVPTLDVYRAAVHHKATLRHFAHYQVTQIDRDRYEDEYERHERGLANLFLQDTGDPEDDRISKFMSDLDLESIGLCCSNLYSMVCDLIY